MKPKSATVNKKKLFLLLAFFAFSTKLNAQHSALLFFENDLPHNTSYNPARYQAENLSILLPLIGYQAYNVQSNVSFEEAFSENAEGRYMLDSEKLYASTPQDISLNASARINLLGIYSSKKRFSFRFNSSMLVLGHMNYDREAIQLSAQGPLNENFIGRTVDISPDFEFQHLHDLMIGGAFQINPRLRVGLNLHLLSGMQSVKKNGEMRIGIPDQTNQRLLIESDASLLHNAGYLSFSPDQIGPQINPQEIVSSLLSMSNIGFSLDAGVHYKLTEKVGLQASILNLDRAVRWNEQIQQTEMNFANNIRRLNNLDAMNNPDSIPELNDDYFFSLNPSGEGEAYLIKRSPTLLAAWSYTGEKHWKAGGVFTGKFYKEQFLSTLSFTANRTFFKFITLGVSANANRYGANAGAMMSLHGAGLKLYMASESLYTMGINPLNSQYLDAQIGLVMNLDRKPKSENLTKSLPCRYF